MRSNKKSPLKSDKTQATRTQKRGVVGYSRKTALLEEAITQMNAGKYGRSSASLKELLALDPVNMEARRLFATLHLRLGSLIPAKQAFDALIKEAFERQDYWLAESLLREYLAAGPRCVPFLEQLGSIYQEKGDALEAVAEYGKAIDILIEDPDPENPQRASQLYAKIRELAPASPVAFRLASSFDAETGELLAPKPSTPEGSATALPPETVDGGQSGPLHPELKKGVMPWDVQDPPEVVERPSDPTPSLEPLSPTTESVNTDAPVHDAQRHDHGVASPEVSPVDQAENILSNVHSEMTEKALAVETPVRQLEPDPVASVADSSACQRPEQVSGTAPNKTTSADSDTASPPTATIDNVQAEVPPSPSDQSPASQALPSETSEPWKQAGFSWESVFNSAWKFSDVPPVKDSPPEPVPARLEEASVESPTVSSPQGQQLESPSVEIPEREAQSLAQAEVASGSSIAPMPWDQVQESTIAISPAQPDSPIAEDSVPARLEETSVESPTISSPQGQQLENPSTEILAREAEHLSQTDVASESSTAPIPWDQVQESAVSIPPAQAGPSPEEIREAAVNRVPGQDELHPIPIGDELQSQPSSLPNHVIAEPESFSFVQESPTTQLSDQPHAVDRTGEAASPIGATDQLAEPEPQFRLASSSAVEEPPTVQESVVVPEPPVPAGEPLVNRPAVQEEVRSEQADLLLKTEESPPSVLPEGDTQKSEKESVAYRSQPAEEIASSIIKEVQVSQPIPPRQSVVVPACERTEVSSPRQEVAESASQEDQLPEVAPVETRVPIPEPVSRQEEEWVKRSESIRFIQDSPGTPMAPAPPAISEPQEVNRPLSVAAAAVDVLFESPEHIKTREVRERTAESRPTRKPSTLLPRIRVALLNFVHSCFSTTRAIVTTLVGLVVLSGLSVALGIGAIALTWAIMEEPPSPAFQSFTTIPQQTLFDSKKNAYTILMGIEASAGQDSLQTGSYEKPEARDGKAALTCLGNPGSETGDRSNASASVMRGWVRSPDPLNQFKAHQETVKGWGSRHQAALEQYGKWQKLPFEDWGYGQPGSPPCAAMVFTHQLYVVDGFLQGTDIGVDRLETDMEAWRAVLGQARTLPVKMLALQAVNDDIAIASGMLVRSDFDGKYLGRITKFLRPLDLGELSMRWPMQNELVSASKTYDGLLKAAKAEDQSIYATVASVLPLPKQRRLNDYAAYYEASYKAAGERQYGSLPKWKDHIHYPAAGIPDYFTNPIENVIGFEPLPAWDLYNGYTVDTDARLRLASLQAWLRRGSSESDLLTRLAKAGQGFYDPYTGMPMLVNMKKGVLYSVGHDGKDQDADPQFDVVVAIPAGQTSAAPAKSSAASSKSR